MDTRMLKHKTQGLQNADSGVDHKDHQRVGKRGEGGGKEGGR